MKKAFSNTIIPILLAVIFSVGTISAQNNEKQVSSSSDLFNEINKQDSLLFDAFNTRDIKTFKSYFSKDLEFFHDKGGLTNYDYTVNFLSETKIKESDLRRDLVKGTLEVYPIPGYGAIEIGSHRFCHDENGKLDCGTFKFVQVWQKKDDQWKVTRVISYAH